MTKVALPLLIAGGVIYTMYAKKHGMAHYDYSKDNGVVYIPKEKYEGKENLVEYEVDDNGKALVDLDTGKLIIKEETTVDRNVEDIFNYDAPSQALFKHSMTNDFILLGDTPEWQREYITSHWDLTGNQVLDMDAAIKEAINNDGVDAEWLNAKEGGTSYYQLWDDYGDWKAQQESTSNSFKTRWAQAVSEAYNKTDIDFLNQNYDGSAHLMMPGVSTLVFIDHRVSTDGYDLSQADSLTSGLFDQHFGIMDTTGRFGTEGGGTTDGVNPDVTWKTLDGVKIVNTEYAHHDITDGSYYTGDRDNRYHRVG